MQDGMFVVDGPVHPCNFLESNWNVGGEAITGLNHYLHTNWNPPELQLSDELFLVDHQVDTLARTLFLESNVDVAVIHHLPLYSWFHDGLVSQKKCEEAVGAWPDRFVAIAGLDPTRGIEETLRSLDAQMEALPQIRGIKLYPQQIEPSLRQYRMDDEKVLFPILEKVVEYGLKQVSIHKALPLGAVPVNVYNPDDVGGAAYAFPQLNFEIVHSGMAWIDETAQSIAALPNVFANFEITCMMMHKSPGQFDDMLGQLLFWGGSEKLCFCSATPLSHPQPLVEMMANYQLSDLTLAKYGLDQLTDSERANILGLNYARALGLDVEECKAKIANDEWAQLRAARGELEAPFSNYRAVAAA